MSARYLDVAGKWDIVLVWDIGAEVSAMLVGWLEALGATRAEARKACNVLTGGLNRGFSYSNPDLQMSLVCIGDASSRAQWWDTVAHEVDHLQNAIMEVYDVEPGTEDAAWLQGYLMRLIVDATGVC